MLTLSRDLGMTDSGHSVKMHISRHSTLWIACWGSIESQLAPLATVQFGVHLGRSSSGAFNNVECNCVSCSLQDLPSTLDLGSCAVSAQEYLQENCPEWKERADKAFPQEGFSRVRLQLVADGKTWVQSGRFSKKEGSVSTRLNMSHPILGF